MQKSIYYKQQYKNSFTYSYKRKILCA
ncbi:unnamed protein product [Larinioides sclopetarius]|uniref:Uncharacterized protein n=1 Tax=Larinioides sclopetarius TaxID=280406 RepID=A0AAV2AZJ7_9ARAC